VEAALTRSASARAASTHRAVTGCAPTAHGRSRHRQALTAGRRLVIADDVLPQLGATIEPTGSSGKFGALARGAEPRDGPFMAVQPTGTVTLLFTDIEGRRDFFSSSAASATRPRSASTAAAARRIRPLRRLRGRLRERLLLHRSSSPVGCSRGQQAPGAGGAGWPARRRCACMGIHAGGGRRTAEIRRARRTPHHRITAAATADRYC
jgi:hypothetical protein